MKSVRAFNWNALLLLATTQVSGLLSVCLHVTGNLDILACILSARDGTVGSAAASLAIRDSPLFTVLVLSTVNGKAEWWASWSDMSVSWHDLSSSGWSVNLRIWDCECSMVIHASSSGGLSWTLCCGCGGCDLDAGNGLAALSEWSVS